MQRLPLAQKPSGLPGAGAMLVAFRAQQTRERRDLRSFALGALSATARLFVPIGTRSDHQRPGDLIFSPEKFP